MKNRVTFSFTAILFSTAAMAQNSPSSALAAAESSAAPTDIVVTARKTSERLQDVPDSISVLTSATLTKSGAGNVTDISNLVPNLTFDPQATPGGLNLSIRGSTMAQGAEAPLAFVIDGVAVPDPIYMNQSLLNVSQVEVLRGPQGSLYGRNALAGVIILETKQPTNEFAGGIMLRYGNGNDRFVQGDLSGPLVKDKLLFSVGASYDKFDGLRENAYLHRKWDHRSDLDVRGRLIFKPTETLTFDLRATHGFYKDGQEGVEIVTPAQFDDYSRPYMVAGTPINGRIKLTDIALKADLDIGGATLTSITDWNRARTILTGDADFSPAPAVLQITTRPVNAWSEELRLSSNNLSSHALKWLVGGFYQDRKIINGLQIPLDNGFGAPTAINVVNSQDHQHSKSWALFGQASYHVTSAFEVTLGARYDSDKRSSTDAAVPGSAAGNTFTEFQPKATVAYHFAKDAQVYASYSRGFRSGGYNAFYSVGGFSRQYGAQVNDNYEFGGKLSAIGGRLFVQGAYYHTQMKNQQLFFINANPPSQNIVVIDKSHVDGGELSLTARITRDFNLSFNLGIADTKIDRFAAAPADKGKHAPIAPLYTMGANADYTIRFDDTNRLVAFVGWNRRGKTYWDTANTRFTPAKDIVDARLSFEHGRFRLTGFAKNLLDQQYPVQALVNAFGPGADGRAISQRRTYGIEGGYRF